MILFNWSNLVFSCDYFSNLLICLSSLLIISCIIISWNSIKFMIKEFYSLLIFIDFLLIFIFISFDLSLFYIFFELILIPIFMIIIIWGSRLEKFKAAYYLFFYTLIGSLIMLLSFFYIYNEIGSTSWYYLNIIKLNKSLVICISIIISMAIKIPILPFHIWLPQAHVEAPISGSILLAGILLKIGCYGLIRFCVLLFYEDIIIIKPILIILSFTAIIYGSMITIRQVDLKKLVAYSSISHMGFINLGLLSNTYIGITGSIIIMISHGFISSSLFIIVTSLYDKYHTRLIRYYKGIIIHMPLISFLFLILLVINLAFPFTINFWGEILIFKSIIYLKKNILLIIIISLHCIFSSIYSFNLINKVIFNKESKYLINKRDMTKNEFFIILIFILITIFFGFKYNFIYNIELFCKYILS